MDLNTARSEIYSHVSKYAAAAAGAPASVDCLSGPLPRPVYMTTEPPPSYRQRQNIVPQTILVVGLMFAISFACLYLCMHIMYRRKLHHLRKGTMGSVTTSSTYCSLNSGSGFLGGWEENKKMAKRTGSMSSTKVCYEDFRDLEGILQSIQEKPYNKIRLAA
mmetsp:Transcript_4101/g.7881  ORF Transcript_4101/g.7881 Transcript_4101/m.7881 type:complete len:162 (-) Transcript_4101:722-1207(-)